MEGLPRGPIVALDGVANRHGGRRPAHAARSRGPCVTRPLLPARVAGLRLVAAPRALLGSSGELMGVADGNAGFASQHSSSVVEEVM